jgi:hypothetical protein
MWMMVNRSSSQKIVHGKDGYDDNSNGGLTGERLLAETL